MPLSARIYASLRPWLFLTLAALLAGSAAYLKIARTEASAPKPPLQQEALELLSGQFQTAAAGKGVQGRVLWAAKLNSTPGQVSDPGLEKFRRALGERLAKIPGWTLIREEDLQQVRPRVKAMAQSSANPDEARKVLEQAFLPHWDFLGICDGDRGPDAARLQCRIVDPGSKPVLEAGQAFLPAELELEARLRAEKLRGLLSLLGAAAAAVAAAIFAGEMQRVLLKGRLSPA